MPKILSVEDLDGYLFKNPSSARFELVSGFVISAKAQGDDTLLAIADKKDGAQSDVVTFRDNGAGNRKLSSRIRKARIRKGDYISILVLYKDGERLASDFKFNGRWRFDGYKGEKNVLIGRAKSMKRADFLSFEERKQDKYVNNMVYLPKTDVSAMVRHLGGNPYFLCVCGRENEFDGDPAFRCTKYKIVEGY